MRKTLRPFCLLTKMQLIRKLTVLLLTLSLLNARATGYSQTITFSGKEVPLERVFGVIETQTGYTVFTNKELLKGTHPVSVSVNDMQLKTFLDLVFQQQPVNYEINNKTIFLKRKNVFASPNLAEESAGQLAERAAQKIGGTVANGEGQPLEGATIQVKGTNRSTTSGSGGVFSIDA
ncbi:MAG: hypothetical protein INR73_17765, partial [Williamsia sp.]|nr:hypothetical protein [Williamsia sp.]